MADHRKTTPTSRVISVGYRAGGPHRENHHDEVSIGDLHVVSLSGRYGKSGMGRADRAASRSMEDQRGDTVPANVVNQQQSPDP